MKGIFTIAALLFFFSSCKESGVQLSKPSTFVKYYSDGNQDDAIDILETSDHGFLILSHSNSSATLGGINVIKTDLSGNVTWQKSFSRDSSNLLASNFVAVKDNVGNDQGYVIVGTVQNLNKSSRSAFGARLFVMRINTDGSIKDSVSYHDSKFGNAISYRAGQGQYIIGKGVAQSSNSTNDIFLIGQVVGPDLTTPIVGGDMYFSQINGSTLNTVFTRTYGGGTSDLASRLYLDYSQTYAYWGGTRADGSLTHVRFVKSGFNSQGTVFDLAYPIDSAGFTGNDFSAYGYGYAFIGENQTAPERISVVRVGSEGDLISHSNYKGPDLALEGNSICSTLDGGLLLLGTTVKDAQGTDTDYYLIKVDGAGTKQWETSLGYTYPDLGVRVLQSSDGGYVVLGTTTLANVKTVVLMKTDLQGKIQ